MRNITFLVLICLLSQQLIAQSPLPSQKEVQAQIKQAKTEAQQMIIDLELQIAEAKKNKDDPESIQELQKQLATMKKALGIVDKAASMTDKRPKATEGSIVTVPPYKSPYTKFYKLAVVIPTEAQAKDKLLWYRGKKINQNTLVTTRGRIIQYDRQNNRVLVQYNEKKDTPIVKLITNLARSRQWTTNMINNVAGRKNSFFDYPLMMMTMKEFDLIEKRFNKLADNTIKLPGTGAIPLAMLVHGNSNSSGPSADDEYTSDLDAWARQKQQELNSLMNNPPPLVFAAPPKHEFDLCYYCDTTLQDKYYADVEAWHDKLNEYESKLQSTCLEIERQYALSTGSDYDISSSGIPGLSQDMDRAYEFIDQRMKQKIEMLKQRYGNDVYRVEAVLPCILGEERRKALLGRAEDTGPDTDIIKIFDPYIQQQIAAKNYNVIFNYAFTLGVERQKALLGTPDEHSVVFDQILPFNRFAFTMDIEFNMVIKDAEDKDVMRATGYLTTPQKTYVSLGRNECKFQLYLFDPDYYLNMRDESLFEIQLSITEGVRLIKEKDTWKSYLYTGPAEMKTVFPSIRVDFCTNGVQDSALMDVIRFSDPDLASVTSADELTKKYTLDMQEYVNLVIASITKVEADRDAVLDITGDILSMQSNTTVTPTGYAQLDQMQLNFNMLQQQLKIKETLTLKTKENPSVVLFDAQNESSTLINKSVNMAGDRGFKIEMKKALVKLKVEHEPM